MLEPASWWTEEERQRFKETLITVERDGKRYYFSPAYGNIYGEDFSWSEPASP